MIEPISRDKSTLYGGRGRQRKKNSKILLFVPTLLATIVATPHNSLELMFLSMNVRIGRSMEDALLVLSHERTSLIMTSN